LNWQVLALAFDAAIMLAIPLALVLWFVLGAKRARGGR